MIKTVYGNLFGKVKVNENLILSRRIRMKKVSGYISVRTLGCYNFEFYVDDNATDEEIKEKVNQTMQLSYDYQVEEGYEEYTEVNYRKKQ